MILSLLAHEIRRNESQNEVFTEFASGSQDQIWNYNAAASADRYNRVVGSLAPERLDQDQSGRLRNATPRDRANDSGDSISICGIPSLTLPSPPGSRYPFRCRHKCFGRDTTDKSAWVQRPSSLKVLRRTSLAMRRDLMAWFGELHSRHEDSVSCPTREPALVIFIHHHRV